MQIRRILQHGQITIPKRILQVLGLKKGDLASVELEGDTIVIIPKKLVEHRTMKYLEETAMEMKGDLPERLTNPRYGEEALKRALQKREVDAPSLEEVRKVTAHVPSLSRLIAEDRDAD